MDYDYYVFRDLVMSERTNLKDLESIQNVRSNLKIISLGAMFYFDFI